MRQDTSWKRPELISAYIAAGHDLVGYRDLRMHCGRFERRRVAGYLDARGHLERMGKAAFRPIRDGELL